MIDRERRERRLKIEVLIRGDGVDRWISLRELADRLYELERTPW